jgi:predicted ATPase
MAQDSQEAKRSELPMRLTRLRVKNFRSIADIDIPLSPLTVLVGPNGSGKSNVVDALRFVRDVFARGLDQAVMDREGMGVIQRWGTEGEGITIGLTFCINQWNRQKYIMEPEVKIDYDFTINELDKGSAHLQKQKILISVAQEDFPQFQIVREGNAFSGVLGDSGWIENLETHHFLPFNITHPIGDALPIELFGFSRPLFYEENESIINSSLGLNKKQGHWWAKLEEVIKELGEYTHNTSFYTLNPAELRQPQRIVKEIPFDENGRNLAAVLRHLSRSGEHGWESLLFALRQVVANFHILEVEPVGGYLATKLLYQADGDKLRASYLGQESDGTIRMLGLLATLYQEPAQPFISIEEPEANIHPGALAVLAGVLDEASLRSQILVTTHSPDMLDHLPAESFLVVEKVGDTTHVGPLDAGQLASVRKRLFTPGELLRMEGLQRQVDAESAS